MVLHRRRPSHLPPRPFLPVAYCLPLPAVACLPGACLQLGSILLRTEAFYRDTLKVTLQLNTTVTGVRTEAKELDVVSGTTTGTVKYDKLLIATGGAPRRFVAPEPFTTPGADLPNIFPLRDAEHAMGVEAAVSAARAAAGLSDDAPLTAPIVVVGSSFIGMEAAAYLRQSRKCTNITVLGMESVPFERVLGKEVGAYMQTLFTQQGVQFRLGSDAVVTRFVPDASGSGGVGSVVLKSGEVLPASIVLVGVGIIPATGFLASAAGIELVKAAPGGVRVRGCVRARGWAGVGAADARRHAPLCIHTHACRGRHSSRRHACITAATLHDDATRTHLLVAQVNEYLKSGADGVFCAGDIANFPYMRGAHDAAAPLYA